LKFESMLEPWGTTHLLVQVRPRHGNQIDDSIPDGCVFVAAGVRYMVR